jgi:hypothetical protein
MEDTVVYITLEVPMCIIVLNLELPVPGNISSMD